MRISDLLDIIENQGKGVRSYIECARICQERINEKPEDAASYYLLKIAANRFVDAYDDQPLLSNLADSEFLNFKNYVDQLHAAEQEADPAMKLSTLNRVAHEIANHKLLRSAV
ncbi:MAG: hypothetical protein P1V13_11635 [Rhizobiaceae bacterium]|nr:hypothetical protein [Rhizobiaceae bacterium]|tara:strand:+ start:9168 stop:9506 length:339 start_codon:yes stop_codon:yes gene_type:complete